MIAFVDVHKNLGGREILDGVNFRIRRGETFVIIGRSGTGKSVTLKHMVGLMHPDRGRVLIDGEEISTLEGRDLDRARRRFGVLFQSAALLNSLTVFENIALPLREHTDLAEPEIRDRVMKTLDLVDLEGKETAFPSEISGGMKKRVGLARAIVLEPEIILYDEPTSGLDPVMSNIIGELIRSMQEKLHVTSVVVTHDMTSAYLISDRIGMLHKGRIVQIGTSKEILQTENPIVRQFIDGKTKGPLTEEDVRTEVPFGEEEAE